MMIGLMEQYILNITRVRKYDDGFTQKTEQRISLVVLTVIPWWIR